jgi:hypothetical protein
MTALINLIPANCSVETMFGYLRMDIHEKRNCKDLCLCCQFSKSPWTLRVTSLELTSLPLGFEICDRNGIFKDTAGKDKETMAMEKANARSLKHLEAEGDNETWLAAFYNNLYELDKQEAMSRKAYTVTQSEIDECKRFILCRRPEDRPFERSLLQRLDQFVGQTYNKAPEVPHIFLSSPQKEVLRNLLTLLSTSEQK